MTALATKRTAHAAPTDAAAPRVDIHESGDALVLTAEVPGLPRDAALLPVVPIVDDRFALTLASMKISGFAVSVFLINHRGAFEEAQRLLAPHRIHVFHIEHERTLHEISPAKIGQ